MDGLAAIRVLIVDDNAQMRSIVGTVLNAAGVGHLYYAPSARDALDLMASVPIDITYVDHEMPGLSGVDFVRMVRNSSSAMQFMPMIMLTGHSDVRRLNEARDSGINEFLGKPVTASAILSRLEAVILRPRPFVRSDTFFGPDRRRRKAGAYHGPMRRASDQAAFV